MAILNKTDFEAKYVSNVGAGAIFKDNTTGDISALDMRNFADDIADSLGFLDGFWPLTGTGTLTGNVSIVGGTNGISISSDYGGLSIDGLQTSFTTASSLPMNFSSSGALDLKSVTSSVTIGSNNITRMTLTSSGDLGFGTASPDRKFHIEVDDASNNAITYLQRFTHTTSGTPAIGIGVGVEFEVETTASNNELIGTIEFVATDVTGGGEDFDFVVKTMRSGGAAAERIRYISINQLLSITGSIDATGSISGVGITSTLGISSGGGEAAFSMNDANNNTVTNVARITHLTSGTPGNGIATGLQFTTESLSGNGVQGGSIESVLTDVTNGSEDGDFVFKTMLNGSAGGEAFRIRSDKASVFTGPAILPTYTVAGVPTASSFTRGMIYVSDETGGAVPAFSDGTNWRRVTDRNIIV